MNRIFTLFVAFALSVCMADAQRGSVSNIRQCEFGVVQRQNGLIDLSKAGLRKAPAKITLPENQKIMGLYDTDEVAESANGIGLPSVPGTLGIASFIPITDVARFDGGDVIAVRYGLANATTVKSVFMYAETEGGDLTLIFEEPVTASSVAGWNTIEFSSRYKLDFSGYTAVLLGFDYVQNNTPSGQYYTADCYPLSFVGDGSTTYVYGNLGQGNGWYDLGSEQLGSLSIQAIVEKDYPDYDLSLRNLSGYAYSKAGAKHTCSFGIKNVGKSLPESYTLNVSVDGKIVSTLDNPVDLSLASSATCDSEFFLPSDLANGKHTLSVSVGTINGVAPTESVLDDKVETTFGVYTESFTHQKQLVEHFTSTSCTYCPLGDEILKTLMTKRDDIARVSWHSTMISYYPDPFKTDEFDVVANYEYLSGYPSASFNRVCFDFGTGEGLSVAQSLGYNSSYKDMVASMFNSALDANNEEYPAFATIGIDAACNPSTGKFVIKVSGNGVDDFTALMGSDAVVNVCLVEDNLSAEQLNQGTWVEAYTHNCVMRKCVSNVYGDAINWNGTTYENDYTLEWNSDWTAKNMRVVAFISRPLKTDNLSDMFVTNTEMANVRVDESLGVSSAAAVTTGVYEVARYTAEGMRLTAPQKGLNIVKLANGKSIKVMVK